MLVYRTVTLTERVAPPASRARPAVRSDTLFNAKAYADGSCIAAPTFLNSALLLL